jgi:hypothetical protein
VLGRVCV